MLKSLDEWQYQHEHPDLLQIWCSAALVIDDQEILSKFSYKHAHAFAFNLRAGWPSLALPINVSEPGRLAKHIQHGSYAHVWLSSGRANRVDLPPFFLAKTNC